jgi:hypothetical protein
VQVQQLDRLWISQKIKSECKHIVKLIHITKSIVSHP